MKTVTRKPDVAKLIHFGTGSDTVHVNRNCSISGYGNPKRPHAADPSKDTLVIPDGCPVIDVREAVKTDAGFKWVFHGPMVNVDLPDSACDPCPQPSPLFAGAVAGNQFGTLLALQADSRGKNEARGPLDSVSISEYLDGWRERGARIGHYESGQIVWDSSEAGAPC